MTCNQIYSLSMDPESLSPQECRQEDYLLRASILTSVTHRRGSIM